MQKSDFILMIKKETDRMVEAWNNEGSTNSSKECTKHLNNIKILIDIMEYGEGTMHNDLSPENPLYEVVDLLAFLSDCKWVLWWLSGLTDRKEAEDEARKSVESARLELQNLPIPVELR